MRKSSNKFTKLSQDLKSLLPGDTLSHVIGSELRQAAYYYAKLNGVELVIREMPARKGKFEVTRVS